MNYLEQIPDTIKAGVAISAPALSLFGITVEEWTFVLSAVVSILFILEKLPGTFHRLRNFFSRLRNRHVKRQKQEQSEGG